MIGRSRRKNRCAPALLLGVGSLLHAEPPLYTAVDLGSLPGGSTTPTAISSGGIVVGTSGYLNSPPGVSQAFAYDDRIGLIDISNGEFYATTAQFINEVGQIAGFGCKYFDQDAVCRGTVFIYTLDLGMVEIEAESATFSAVVNGFNNSGVICGTSRIDALATRAIRTLAGVINDLGTLADDRTGSAACRGINDAGQIVGYAWTGSRFHAFRYTGFTMDDLGTLTGPTGQSAAAGINQAGDVCGWSQAAGGQIHAFRFNDDAGLEDLHTIPGSTTSAAQAVNDAGDVIGSFVDPSGSTRAFLANDATGMRDLGSLGGAAVYLSALNDSDEVVGSALDATFHPRAVIWTPNDGLVDLNRLTELDPGVVLQEAVAINPSGQVVARSMIDGVSHAFLLTPQAQYRLSASPLLAGAAAVFTVSGATPAARQYLVLSTAGLGRTTVNALGVTLALAQPVVAGQATASAEGRASWRFVTPANALGKAVWFQVVESAHVSNVVGRRVRQQ